MKKLLFVFSMLFFAVGISTVNAQTTSCTPAQQAACKKICSTAKTCTPAQQAACQKVCDKGNSTKTASTSEATNPFVNVGTTSKTAKAISCCQSSKLTSGIVKGCSAKKSNVVTNEKSSKTPIAQTVAMKSAGSEK